MQSAQSWCPLGATRQCCRQRQARCQKREPPRERKQHTAAVPVLKAVVARASKHVVATAQLLQVSESLKLDGVNELSAVRGVRGIRILKVWKERANRRERGVDRQAAPTANDRLTSKQTSLRVMWEWTESAKQAPVVHNRGFSCSPHFRNCRQAHLPKYTFDGEYVGHPETTEHKRDRIAAQTQAREAASRGEPTLRQRVRLGEERVHGSLIQLMPLPS